MAARVWAVVLSWNRRDDTLACLEALAAQAGAGPAAAIELVVVDNASTDDSVAAVRRVRPEVEVLALPANRGYAAGTNAGVRRALARGADWTLLVNNDARPAPTMLAELLGAADAPSVGMLAPTVYHADDPTRVWPSAGWRRRATLAAFDTTAAPPSALPYDVEWATGCCLLVRAALWASVGLFDERYFFYYEDHDLCLRARRAGWRIRHVPAATAWHSVAASTGRGSPRQAYLLARGSVPFYWTHTAGAQRVFIVSYRLASLAATVARALARRRPDVAVAALSGVIDGARDAATWGRRAAATGRWPAHGSEGVP